MDYDNRSKEELIAELENLKQEMTILKELSKYPLPGPEFAVAGSLSPESLYSSLLNALPDTITITNLQGLVLYSSPQTIEMFGYGNPKDVLSKSLFDFLESDDAERARTNFGYILNGIQNRTHEYLALKSDRSTFNIEVNGDIIRDGEGNPLRVVLVIRDITERKQSEEQLKKLFLAVEQSPVSVVITDLDATIEYVNPAFLNTTGYTLEEIIGANPRILKSGLTDKEVYSDLWKTITAGKVWHGEWLDKKKNGELFWEQVSINPIIAENGKITNYLAVKQDITNRKNSEEIINDLNANLERKIVDRTALLAKTNEALGIEIAARKLASLATEEALERLNKIADRLPGAVYQFQLNPDGSSCFPFVSEGIRGIYGVTPEEVACDASVVLSRIHPDDFEEVVASIQVSARELTLWRQEYRIKLKDGTVHWLSGNAFPQLLADGTVLWHGFITDISERMQAEEALHWNQSLLQMMSNSSPLGFLVVDNRDDIILYFNNRFCEIWGIEHIADQMRSGKMKNNDIIPHCLPVLVDVPGFAESCKPLQDESNRIVVEDEIAFTQNRTVRRFSTQIRGGNDEYYGRFYIFEDITEQKRVIAEFEESREKHRGLSEAAFDSIFFSEKGVCIEQNQMAEKVFGYTSQEAIGRYGTEWIVPEDRKLVMENMLAGKDEPYEVTAVKKDGTTFPCMLSGKMMFYKGRNVRVTSLSDISARKQAEAALKASEKRFSLFMDYLPALVFIKDTDSRMLYSNNAMDKALGASAWTGKSLFEFFDPETAARIIEDDQKTVQLGYQLIEESFTNLDGKLHHYETQKFVIPRLEENPLIGGIALDITDRKLSEEKFSRAFQFNSALMTISLVHDGRFLEINDTFMSKLGYSREELIGNTPVELNLYADLAILDKIFENLSDKIAVREVELEIRTKSGGFITCLFSADNIYIGNELCILAVMVDITDRKQIEKDIVKAKNEAEKANHAKSEFLSRMSHELRTPLNSILGFAQLLQMGELHPRQRNGVNHISQSGKHLLDLINEVLDISGIEAGRISLLFEPIQLNGIILETIDAIKPLITKRDLRVEVVNSTSNQLFVRADRQRLKQVLMNLLSNAIKYDKEGGVITITTGNDSTYGESKALVRISISDTGSGITAEDIPKLFTPFERIGAEKTNIEGTGLGLTVARKLIDAMSGKIGVESVPGEGSTFWIELPQSMSQPESIKIHEGTLDPAACETSRPATILYIEDNRSNIELVEQIFFNTRSAISLITANRGEETMQMAIEHNPNLILLDLDLPDMHGSEVILHLQADNRTKNIPVIIISADANPLQIGKLLNAGARNYLTKPLDVNAFLEIVDNFIITVT